MDLSKLLQGIYSIPENLDREISQVTLDSRLVQKNSLFIALKGSHYDGCEYIDKAISKGAIAVLIDAETQSVDSNIPLIPIQGLKEKLGKIAAKFYGNPASKLHMIGVTGTSGKTSCTYFIAQCLQSLNIPCGLIGTLGSGMYGEIGPAGLTTPDAVTLQSILQDLVNQKAKAVAMEVSSHSIDQGRINNIDYDLGIFTNLSQDHLDYHGDMESYAAVKRRFVADLPVKEMIINADDVRGLQWINELATHKPIIAYSTKKLSLPKNIPQVYTEEWESSSDGIKAKLKSPWGDAEITIPLVGEFNLSNSLAVFTALHFYGIPFNDAVHCISQLKPVPGRMEKLGGGIHPLIVVDYAHKPDALEKVLLALRSHTQGKLWCVFGCGGERDKGKRPLMARIAEKIADEVIVTNDNPRHENPVEIAADIMRGFSRPQKISVELDRSKAIRNSIQCATAGDCILIAGKGAEHYQQVGDEKLPFDDVEKVREYLAELSEGR